jgi:hypothetical protein
MQPRPGCGRPPSRASFTVLSRFVALEMLEARRLVQECITDDEVSAPSSNRQAIAPATNH